MKTKFYTENWGKEIAEVENGIPLNHGDIFLDSQGNWYKVTKTIYNPFLNLMIYFGALYLPKEIEE